MRSVAVIGRKGGSGKTTIAVHLAIGLHLRGQDNWSLIVRHVLSRLVGAGRNGPFLITFLPIFLGLRRMRDVGLDAPLVGELPGMTKIAGTASQEIGVDGNDYICLGEIVDGVDRAAKRQHRALVSAVAAAHFILMPFGAGKFLQDRNRIIARVPKFEYRAGGYSSAGYYPLVMKHVASAFHVAVFIGRSIPQLVCGAAQILTHHFEVKTNSLLMSRHRISDNVRIRFLNKLVFQPRITRGSTKAFRDVV